MCDVDDVRGLCGRLKGIIQTSIEISMDDVCADNERHAGTIDKICGRCFRNKPWATKKCGHCGSTEFHDYICTKEIRFSLFKDWLQSQGYWPLSHVYDTSCRSFLGTIPSSIDRRTLCGLDDSCPLVKSKEQLTSRLRDMPDQYGGLVLGDYEPGFVQRYLKALQEVSTSPLLGD